MSGIHVSPDMDPKDALAHYGVLGMKWGKTRVKADAAQIRTARASVSQQKRKLNQQGRKMTLASEANRAAESKKYAEMKTEFLKNPDRVTAARLTTGEKAVHGILGLTVVGAVLPVATIGISSARSRRIEQKQDKGAYDR